MTSDTIALLRASFSLAAGDPPALLGIFLRRLALRAPGVQELLPVTLLRDPDRFATFIAQLLRLLERRDMLVEALQILGRRQASYAALPARYPAIGQAFRETLAIRLGPAWAPVTDAAWSEFQALVTRIMGAAHLVEYQRLSAV